MSFQVLTISWQDPKLAALTSNFLSSLSFCQKMIRPYTKPRAKPADFQETSKSISSTHQTSTVLLPQRTTVSSTTEKSQLKPPLFNSQLQSLTAWTTLEPISNTFLMATLPHWTSQPTIMVIKIFWASCQLPSKKLATSWTNTLNDQNWDTTTQNFTENTSKSCFQNQAKAPHWTSLKQVFKWLQEASSTFHTNTSHWTTTFLEKLTKERMPFALSIIEYRK